MWHMKFVMLACWPLFIPVMKSWIIPSYALHLTECNNVDNLWRFCNFFCSDISVTEDQNNNFVYTALGCIRWWTLFEACSHGWMNGRKFIDRGWMIFGKWTARDFPHIFLMIDLSFTFMMTCIRKEEGACTFCGQPHTYVAWLAPLTKAPSDRFMSGASHFW